MLERLNASGHFEYSAAECRLYHEGKIYVSEALRDVIMEGYHDSPLAGHFGAEKTQALIQRKYFWPKLAKDVGEHVASYSVCAMTKSARHKSYGNPCNRGSSYEDVTLHSSGQDARRRAVRSPRPQYQQQLYQSPKPYDGQRQFTSGPSPGPPPQHPPRKTARNHGAMSTQAK